MVMVVTMMMMSITCITCITKFTKNLLDWLTHSVTTWNQEMLGHLKRRETLKSLPKNCSIFAAETYSKFTRLICRGFALGCEWGHWRIILSYHCGNTMYQANISCSGLCLSLTVLECNRTTIQWMPQTFFETEVSEYCDRLKRCSKWSTGGIKAFSVFIETSCFHTSY